ncbi:MAG: type transport system ATP-binding protein [Solirubrobacteraceae bacterium]|jgi:ABC-2 type transport system ATP-binding protein|nr:type transport system ATP-binding protein [Solirubrobacteraceae bacterium]
MITNSLDVAVAQRRAAAIDRPDAVIEVSGLRKSYGEHEAVAGIDLEVFRGEIFAFLGPNGAGKTTTVEILEGFRGATAGKVEVLGADPARAKRRANRAWRERIGIVLQESAPEPGLTVRECLELFAGYYRAPRPIEETMELAGLTEVSSQRATELSGGQRRRLDVALALIGDPELIFLDEPTTGFDPSARRAAWSVIEGLRDLGKTVFLTTHYMEEAERLADRIAIIAAGRIIAQGTPRTLGGRDTSAARITFTMPTGTDAAADLPPLLAERAEPQGDGRVALTSAGVAADLHALSGWALERDLELADLEVRRATLEDVYLELVAQTQEIGGRP